MTPTLTITTDKTSVPARRRHRRPRLAVTGAPDDPKPCHITGTATVRTADGTIVQLPASDRRPRSGRCTVVGPPVRRLQPSSSTRPGVFHPHPRRP